MMCTKAIKKYKNGFILIINFLLIFLGSYILWEDYCTKGHFEIFNEDNIRDGEELYFNLFAVIFILFSSISILKYILEKYEKRFLFFRICEGLYGILLLFISIIYFLFILLSLPNAIYNMQDQKNNTDVEPIIYSLSLFIITLICIFFFSINIIRKNFEK